MAAASPATHLDGSEPGSRALETVIRPSRSWTAPGDFRELLAYRDLLGLLVWRDFVAKYKQTVLGPLWFILQPLLTTLVFTVIFGKVAGISTDGTPPVLFYLCGLLGWNYFAQTFSASSETFTANSNLFGKVYFPRLVIPLSSAISNLAALILNGVIFAGFWTWFRFGTASFEPELTLGGLLLLPLGVLLTAVVALGAGLWMATLTAKYRDLTHLTAFLVQLWLYATPVIYPLSAISPSWQWLAALNPMAPVIEIFRALLLGTEMPPLPLVALAAVTSTLLLLSALLAFSRTQRRFIDTV